MSTQFPLREKRKAATRKSLIRSAQVLFIKQGYEQTTLEEVAQHAGLHVQTLYRHFANKLELAAAGDEERLIRFRRAIQDPNQTETTFVFWRDWMLRAVTRLEQADGVENYREQMIELSGPAFVSGHLIRIGLEYEDLLTESLARDFNMPAQGIGTPRLVAIMLWGVHSHVIRSHAKQEGFDFTSEAIRVIDSVEELFGHLVVES